MGGSSDATTQSQHVQQRGKSHGRHVGDSERAAMPGGSRVWRRPLVMGILNVTPDSFSDGGRWTDPSVAVAHARDMVADGADIVDVGGESTRPGSRQIDVDTETRRVLPPVRALVREGVRVSVDTMRARTAEAVLDAGAEFVNDVSGGLADPDMLRVVAERRAPFILSHWRGHLREASARAVYRDVVAEVAEETGRSLDAAVAAGVDPERIVLDPGLGFSKEAEHNWALLRSLEAFRALGRPVLLGASRKRFLGALAEEVAGASARPADSSKQGGRDADDPVALRDVATAAVSVEAGWLDVWGVRVHDVAATSIALRVGERLWGGRTLDGQARHGSTS